MILSHSKGQRFRSRRPRGRFSMAAAFGWICVGCLLALSLTITGNKAVVVAKEVEATSEWTLLGENDTVAAGMHVRMDLSTGEKWVKTVDDNDDQDGQAKGSSVSAGMVVVDAKGDVTAAVQEAGVTSSEKTIMHNDVKQEEPNYDYEMMHRALSNLPPDEQERMGGIPRLPDYASSKVTPEQRQIFEQRMKEIWEQRQLELKAFQEHHLADLPQLLKDRIASLRSYLQNPRQQLRELDIGKDTDDDYGDTTDEEGKSAMVSDILEVLKDLEYHLNDLDMTRDFHTLGGWPILSSLLADAVHENIDTRSNVTSSQDIELTDDDWNKVNLLQAHAAWIIGTAVKNTEEFFPFATAEVEVVHHTEAGDKNTIVTSAVKTTPLDLVLAQFVASSNAALDTNTSPDDEYYATVMMKAHKMLYALGSLLRGNRQAQTHFCADQGPALLANVLVRLAKHDQVQASNNLPKDLLKMTQRLLSLAQDIVTDVTLHASMSRQQLDEAIQNSFSSDAWCTSLVQFTHIPRLYETTLLTIQALAPHCAGHWDTKQVQLHIEKPPAKVFQTWLPEDLDPEIRTERMDLMASTLQAISTAKQ